MEIIFLSNDRTGVDGITGTHHYKCLMCGNEVQFKFGKFVSFTEQKEIVYCRSCLQFGRITQLSKLNINRLNIWESFQYQFETSMPNLTIFQEFCFESLSDCIYHGVKDIDIIAVTGAGKTEIIFKKMAEMVCGNNIVAYVCPRRDVIIELRERMQRYFPNHLIVSFHDHNVRQMFGHIYIITIHQLIRFRNFFDCVVIDESDAFPYVGSDESQNLHNYIMQSCKDGALRIYLTATPKVFHEQQIFLATRFNMRPLAIPKYFRVNKLLDRLLQKRKIEQFKTIRYSEWLIFVPTIKIGEIVLQYIAEYFPQIKCEFVHSKAISRSESIERLRNHEISCLITTAILERGVTFDDISVMILFPEHQLFSKEMIIQICGRVDRGKTYSSFQLIALFENYSSTFTQVRKYIKGLNKKSAQQLSNMPK